MKERIVNFTQGAPYGTEHYEHGRTWEFVAPGMWKSVAGAGGGVGDVYWDDILDKPIQIKNLASENAEKVSMISGGNY